MYPTGKNADQQWGKTTTVRPWLGASAAALALGMFCQNASAQFYAQSNLVSDVPGMAAVTDTNLVGAWGTTHTPTSPWWVNTTASGLSLLFNGQGQPLPLVVAIPPTNPATATGITANSGTGFQVESNLPAIFIFATLNGTISGWNPHQTNPQLAVLEIDNSGKAQYSGVAVGQLKGQDTLYAANFAQNRIDVFDSSWHPMSLSSTAFMDTNVPPNLTVFNVMNINGALVVTYAPTNALRGPNLAGDGYVDIYNPNGVLRGTLESGPWMNSPWGVALVPKKFGKFEKTLLIGMFGNGNIAAFDTKHGHFRGLLQDTNGQPITLMGKGLWGLGFGNGSAAGPVDSLYFATDFVTSGHFHGLFGTLTRVAENEDQDQGEDQNQNHNRNNGGEDGGNHNSGQQDGGRDGGGHDGGGSGGHDGGGDR